MPQVLSGATLDLKDGALMTPLMTAITKEQNDVVKYLVQAGAALMAKVLARVVAAEEGRQGNNYKPPSLLFAA